LLRCVGIDICTEGRCGTTDSSDEGAQCLGTHRFSLAVCPHKGNWIDAKLYSAVEEYTLSPRMYQVSKANEGRLPMDMSLLEVSNPDVQLAAVKKAQREEGIVIRIYNPTQSSQSCDLKLAGNISKAFKTDMNEEKQQELNLDGNTISLDLGPCKIVTVLIEV
jgi:mannosylglycerate hydrolase